jgi:hypothetical protein
MHKFSRVVSDNCGGPKFSHPVRDALFTVLLSEHTYQIVESCSSPQKCVFYMPIYHAEAWPVLLMCIEKSPFDVRQVALADVTTLLHNSYDNAQSMHENKAWQAQCLLLFSDIPKYRRTQNHQRSFAFSINIFTCIQSQFFLRDEAFEAKLLSTFSVVYAFAGYCSESCTIMHTILASLMTKLKAKKSLFPTSEQADALEWRNFRALLHVLRWFMFETAYWKNAAGTARIHSKLASGLNSTAAVNANAASTPAADANEAKAFVHPSQRKLALASKLSGLSTAASAAAPAAVAAASEKAAEPAVTTVHITFASRKDWLPDEAVTACPGGCNGEFGAMKRKHHCRVCGGIFCKTCLPRTVEKRRCCVACWRSVQKIIKSRAKSGAVQSPADEKEQVMMKRRHQTQSKYEAALTSTDDFVLFKSRVTQPFRLPPRNGGAATTILDYGLHWSSVGDYAGSGTVDCILNLLRALDMHKCGDDALASLPPDATKADREFMQWCCAEYEFWTDARLFANMFSVSFVERSLSYRKLSNLMRKFLGCSRSSQRQAVVVGIASYHKQ